MNTDVGLGYFDERPFLLPNIGDSGFSSIAVSFKFLLLSIIGVDIVMLKMFCSVCCN